MACFCRQQKILNKFQINLYILFRIIIAFLGIRASGQHATGLIFDDQAYSRLPRISPSLKLSEEDAPVFSLKKYCPSPGNQRAGQQLIE